MWGVLAGQDLRYNHTMLCAVRRTTAYRRMRVVWAAAAVLLVGCPGSRQVGPNRDARGEGLIWPDLGPWPFDGPRPDRSPLPTPDKTRPPDAALPPDTTRPPDTAPPTCPGGCDDADPCTADACVGGVCHHDPIGQQVGRFFSASTGAHAYSLGAGPGGFGAEAPVFRTLAAASGGAVAIYQQTNGKDYMLSQSSSEGVACCGYTNDSSIGFGFTGAVGSAIPLYRLYHSSGLHLSSTSSTEGTAQGYVLEGVTAYVCPL
jgi:hypothetical protein